MTNLVGDERCRIFGCDSQAVDDSHLEISLPIGLCPACRAQLILPIATYYEARLDEAMTQAVQARKTLRSERSVVYFIRFGDRFKIGTTINLDRRMMEIQHDEVLLVIPGSHDIERVQHQRFTAHQVRGEWFEWNPETEAMVRKLAAWQARQDPNARGSLIPR